MKWTRKRKKSKPAKRSVRSKRLIRVLFVLILVGPGLILLANLWVVQSSKARVFEDLVALPKNKVGLVLGTSRYLRSGTANPFFKNRIEAAARLYHAGKVSHLLVSGDNRHRSYNEPKAMKDALIKLGVPAEHISSDYAGLRTLDSIVRTHLIFGQTSFTVISQRNHDYRALFIASFYKLDAVAWAAKEAPLANAARVHSREVLARVKAVLDLYILRKKPKHLGEPVKITHLHFI